MWYVYYNNNIIFVCSFGVCICFFKFHLLFRDIIFFGRHYRENQFGARCHRISVTASRIADKYHVYIYTRIVRFYVLLRDDNNILVFCLFSIFTFLPRFVYTDIFHREFWFKTNTKLLICTFREQKYKVIISTGATKKIEKYQCPCNI